MSNRTSLALAGAVPLALLCLLLVGMFSFWVMRRKGLPRRKGLSGLEREVGSVLHLL